MSMTSAQIAEMLRSWQASEWVLSDDLVDAVVRTLEQCERKGLPLPHGVEVVDECLWVHDPKLPEGKFPASIVLHYFDATPSLGDVRLAVSDYPPSVSVQRYTKRLWRAAWKNIESLQSPHLFEMQSDAVNGFVLRVVTQFGLTG